MTVRPERVAEEIRAGRLQRIVVGDVTAPQLVSKAQRMLRAAGLVLEEDADAAYVLAYDAARLAGTGILAAHGVRPTARGGHAVVESVLKDWYGTDVEDFGTLRRRRNELEYPRDHVEITTSEEAGGAIEAATAIVRLAHDVVLPPSSS
jgi:hypothetical protein